MQMYFNSHSLFTAANEFIAGNCNLGKGGPIYGQATLEIEKVL